jgi:hypothetical protein
MTTRRISWLRRFLHRYGLHIWGSWGPGLYCQARYCALCKKVSYRSLPR